MLSHEPSPQQSRPEEAEASRNARTSSGAESEDASLAHVASQSQAQAAQSKKIDILLVDDREENLMAMEAVLESPDYNLVKLTSGQDALRYLLDHQCALILLDVQMPGIDGFETAALIKQNERTRSIPIIFVTAISRNEQFVFRGYETGAVDYLLKPFDPVVLRSKVAVFADLFRKTQRLEEQAELIRASESNERRRMIAELELKSLRREQYAQQRYRDLVEGIQDGLVWTADPTTYDFTFMSPSAERILGFAAERFTASSGLWMKQIHPEDRETVEHAFRDVMQTRREAKCEHRLLSADGRTVWFETNLRVNEKSMDTELEFRGLSIDITPRKKAEEALRLSEERARFLADASLALSGSLDQRRTLEELGKLAVPRLASWYGVYELGTEGTARLAILQGDVEIDEKSAELQEILAQLRIEPNGQTPAGRVFQSGKPELIPEISESNLHRITQDSTHSELLRRIKLRSLMAVPILVQGKIWGVLSLGQTSQDKRYTEADFQMAQELGYRASTAIENSVLYSQAQEAIRSRDEFLSIASHELKTPLTPLKLQMQSLLRLMRGGENKINAEKIQKVVSTADRQISRLSSLIEDLLDISRINVGKLMLNRELFNLSELVGDVVERFHDQFVGAGCTVDIDVEEVALGNWDRFRIEQVIINLITNAMKYGAGKPVHIQVGIAGGKATLSVRDEGIGIAPSDQKRIFERFERATSAAHFGGLGLGLYIVSQILTAHGGTIRVQSKPQEGSTFVVELPLAEEMAQPA